MPKFIQLLGVAEQAAPNCYIATIIADEDDNGTYETVAYGVTPEDNYGIAPEVKAAVTEWINNRQPVSPYVPPTSEQLRAVTPPITRRQLLLTLFSIGITEAQIDDALVDDVEGLIEWKNASTFERLHPLISELSGHFGLPPEQVDSLWLWARNL
ncbi:hypothetical protein [Sinorhizobium meliloti]|uniref:Uncharacterized protein n=1 Tax=Rhizobium meliloti TaxID=382 RepID=A0AAW9TLG8_RHIML|nr:hypothetical protein [Sinorhizobium meliloti]MDX0260525.1 hypothetical protein [Sinorhizobium meliloti]MDX0347780.1 hypothetical protein [Sinorhizobium meliloti]MQW33581.1 hypothetical protein [Sinorhizobium meliloti]MQW46087.1 hypothetical protein [Sinorhizobium meliloti]